jgi:hypothetical protein
MPRTTSGTPLPKFHWRPARNRVSSTPPSWLVLSIVIGRGGVADADVGTRTTHYANAAEAIRNSRWPNADRRIVSSCVLNFLEKQAVFAFLFRVSQAEICTL